MSATKSPIVTPIAKENVPHISPLVKRKNTIVDEDKPPDFVDDFIVSKSSYKRNYSLSLSHKVAPRLSLQNNYSHLVDSLEIENDDAEDVFEDIPDTVFSDSEGKQKKKGKRRGRKKGSQAPSRVTRGFKH